MNGINNIQAEGQLYDILAPEVVNDYVEKLGKPCANPNGYTTGSLILATDGGNVQRLYKVTQPITSSQNIVEDGNVVRKKLGDLFDDLEVALDGEIDDVDTELGNVKQALSDEVETRATLGAHNLMPLTIERLKANNAGGTWTGNNYAIHGITFAIATDNGGNVTSITLSGATTTDVALLYLGEITPQHGSYIISSFPEGESHTGCSALYRIYSSASSYNDVYVPTQSTIEYTGVKIVAYICRISPGITISTPVVYYPMLRVSKDSLKDFTPYAMTNRELTDEVTPQTLTYSVETYGGTIKATKIGKLVTIQANGIGATQNITTEGLYLLATLPTGWRPNNNINVVGFCSGDNHISNEKAFSIGTAGNIGTYKYDGENTITNGLFIVSFVVD